MTYEHVSALEPSSSDAWWRISSKSWCDATDGKEETRRSASNQHINASNSKAKFFPDSSNAITLAAADDVKAEKKLFLCSVNFSSAYFFKFNAVGYRARFDFSRVPFGANVKVKLRWFNQLLFFVRFRFCLSLHGLGSVGESFLISDGTWILFSFIGFARKEGRSAGSVSVISASWAIRV